VERLSGTVRVPAWLVAERAPGRIEAVPVPVRGLRVRLWSPLDADPATPLPLLVAHDGDAYAAEGGLLHFSAATIAASALPPHRVALLDADDRAEAFSASPYHARTLCLRVLPLLARRVAVRGGPVVMGASLGALAALHAHRRFPGRLGGLFLQSGSYFMPRFDDHESDFGRYPRIVAAVAAMLAAPRTGAGRVPVTVTCAEEEENVRNNRLVAAALAEQGHPLVLALAAGGHDYPTWRAALHPHLTDLLERAWG
jgi:enterochelin esterase family protein